MTGEEFREIALAFPGAEERSHMNHPDFRLMGKIFATLGPDESWGMAKLTPEQQRDYIRISRAFTPAAGKWGESGATVITLADADRDEVLSAIELAYRNITKKK